MYFLTICLHSIIFRLVWRVIKKQTIFIDPEKYQFTYSYKKLRLGKWTIYTPIAIHGKKQFITPERFTEAKDYKVIFLSFL